MRSKRDEFRTVIAEQMRDAISEVARSIQDEAVRKNLMSIEDRLTNSLQYRITEKYRWLQICDIFAWKRRKVAD